MNKKELYAAPETEVLELRIEQSILNDSVTPTSTEEWTFD